MSNLTAYNRYREGYLKGRQDRERWLAGETVNEKAYLANGAFGLGYRRGLAGDPNENPYPAPAPKECWVATGPHGGYLSPEGTEVGLLEWARAFSSRLEAFEAAYQVFPTGSIGVVRIINGRPA